MNLYPWVEKCQMNMKMCIKTNSVIRHLHELALEASGTGSALTNLV